jgi:hypothetical protein
MINTEKIESQNTVTTTVKRLCDAAASAPTFQTWNVLRIREDYGTDDSREEVPETTIGHREGWARNNPTARIPRDYRSTLFC